MRTLTPILNEGIMPYQTSENSRACRLDLVLSIMWKSK